MSAIIYKTEEMHLSCIWSQQPQADGSEAYSIPGDSSPSEIVPRKNTASIAHNLNMAGIRRQSGEQTGTQGPPAGKRWGYF